MPSYSPIDITLTGPTGLLGHYLLAALLRRPEIRCRLLVRSPIEDAVDRLSRLMDPLGVDLQRYIADHRVTFAVTELPQQVDPAQLEGTHVVIHAAANTRLTDQEEKLTRTNVNGTSALLDACDRAGVERFLLVSTAYVCGHASGTVPEAVTDIQPRFRNAYEKSKWQAEQLVAAWAVGDRTATICRPSILIGDRATGRTTAMNGLYIIMRATELLARAVIENNAGSRNDIPLRIVGRSNATVNVIPVCLAAEQIAAIALNAEASSRVVHIVNPDPPTHLEIKTWLEAYFRIGGGRFTDNPWPWPDASPYEEAFYTAGNPVHDYFHHDLRFASAFISWSDRGTRLVDRAQFMRCLEYAVRHRWGRAIDAWPRAAPPRGIASPTTPRTDPRWYFEDFVPARIPLSRLARISTLTAVVRFVVEDVAGGEWTYQFYQGQLADWRRGRNGATESFGFRIKPEAFDRIVASRATIQSQFFNGQADVFGDVLQAMKMVPLISSFLSDFQCDLEPRL